MPRIKVTEMRNLSDCLDYDGESEEKKDEIKPVFEDMDRLNEDLSRSLKSDSNPVYIFPKFRVPIMLPKQSTNYSLKETCNSRLHSIDSAIQSDESDSTQSDAEHQHLHSSDKVCSETSADVQHEPPCQATNEPEPLNLCIRQEPSLRPVIQLPILTPASSLTQPAVVAQLPHLVPSAPLSAISLNNEITSFLFDEPTSDSIYHSTQNADAADTVSDVSGELSEDKANLKKEEEFVPCLECGKTLRRGSLREHMDRHTGLGKFSCESCGKTFSRSSALEKHRLTHTGEKPFACPICDKSYRQKVHLNEHMRSHTGERPYLCPICNFSLASKSLLNRHVRTHSDKRDYVCQYCDKTFKRREGLLAHQATHDTEKRHTCEHCQRAFSTSRALKCHQVVHSDERPYPCHLCDKAFKTAKLLRNHVATHSDLKPFSCPTCGKTFRTKVYLDNHSQVHIKDRFFECGACSRQFHHKSSLEKHMRKTHGQKCEYTISYTNKQSDEIQKSNDTQASWSEDFTSDEDDDFRLEIKTDS